MVALLFANNASTTLAGPITSTATTVNVASGSGVLFPAPGASQYFKLTFLDAATKSIREIVHVTAVSADSFTITRAQEGTTAVAWNAGDFAANQLTAGTLGLFAQAGSLPSTFYTGTDTGSAANALVVPTTSPSTPTLAAGQIYFLTKNGTTNTGAVTIKIGAAGVISVVYGDGGALNPGDWPASASAWVYYTGGTFQILAPPVTLTAPLLHRGDDTSGTPNTITVTVIPAISAYAEGQRHEIKLANNITGSGAVANICGLGNRTIVRADGVPTQTNDGLAGQMLDVIDDGTRLQIAGLLTPQSASQAKFTFSGSQTGTDHSTIVVPLTGTSPAWGTLAGNVLTITQAGLFSMDAIIAMQGSNPTTEAIGGTGNIIINGATGSPAASASLDYYYPAGSTAFIVCSFSYTTYLAVGATVQLTALVGGSNGDVISIAVTSASLNVVKEA